MVILKGKTCHKFVGRKLIEYFFPSWLVFTSDGVRVGVVSGVGRKWKRSDSSDSDSVALMTLLTTPIFDFHYVKRSYDSAYDSDSDSVASENQP